MKEAQILEALDEPVWMNCEGDIVMYAEEDLGMKATHRVKHPEYMIFVDEVGKIPTRKMMGKSGAREC